MSGATWYHLEVQNASGGILLDKWYIVGDEMYWGVLCRDPCGMEQPAQWRLQMADSGLWRHGYGPLTALQNFTLESRPRFPYSVILWTLDQLGHSFNWTVCVERPGITWKSKRKMEYPAGQLVYSRGRSCAGYSCVVSPGN